MIRALFSSSPSSTPVITRADIKKTYEALPSIVNQLPWRDYHHPSHAILLEDNESLGMGFCISPLSCEARPDAMLSDIAHAIQDAFQQSIPLEKESPWILQCYVEKNADLSSSYESIEDYFYENQTRDEPNHTGFAHLKKTHLAHLKTHLEYVSRPGGIFFDNKVNRLSFRGGLLNIRAVLYRRQSNTQRKHHDPLVAEKHRLERLEEIETVSRKWCDQLRAVGITIHKMTGRAFYTWMAGWFNPKHLLSSMEPSFDTVKPIGYDLSESVFFHTPVSFDEGWILDGLPHKVVTIQQMTKQPVAGHLTAERKRGTDDALFHLIDHLPEGSIFVLTIVLQAQRDVEAHLKKIANSAIGHHASAMNVKKDLNLAEQSMADGNPLFPVVMALYLRGETEHDLKEKEAASDVLLNSNGFKVVGNAELFPVDAYLRHLPMCYDVAFDKKNTHRSRFMMLSDIAKLLPFYGRSRGTAHPGMVMFNRGGEPWFYDLAKDKTKNSHFLLLGESGTGKSNLLNTLIMHDLAKQHSRFFIHDAGGSFDLLGDYIESLGLTVNKIKIDPKNPVSLNPFAYGVQVIQQIEAFQQKKSLFEPSSSFIEMQCDQLEDEIETNGISEQKPHKQENEESEPRDILGDMVLAALIMITGGEKKEEEAIRRSDRMLIMDAIIDAAYTVAARKKEHIDLIGSPSQMIASDIIDAFERMSSRLPAQSEKHQRVIQMADAMRYFVNDPISSRFFNTVGTPWPLVDVTIIDYGLFANEGYEAQRSIAFAGCMSRVLALAELNQRSQRPIQVVLDENHLFTSITLLADIETRVAKMGRKLGLWLWIATQNVRDFSDHARRMLAQIEHWMCLALPPDEIDQIERFKPLTAEERALFLSARKEKGKYTEGVLLSPSIKGLFRSIPPRIYLAMAATDQEEKYRRACIMKETGCSELDAVKVIAESMMQKKEGG